MPRKSEENFGPELMAHNINLSRLVRRRAYDIWIVLSADDQGVVDLIEQGDVINSLRYLAILNLCSIESNKGSMNKILVEE